MHTVGSTKPHRSILWIAGEGKAKAQGRRGLELPNGREFAERKRAGALRARCHEASVLTGSAFRGNRDSSARKL
jgi:hypothetical protein